MPRRSQIRTRGHRRPRGAAARVEAERQRQEEEARRQAAEAERQRQAQAAAEQQAREAVKRQEFSREFTNSIGMEFVLIEPGTFQMGSPATEPGRSDTEGPVHEETISQPLYLGKYEVTQEQWQTVMEDNPSYFSNCGRMGNVDMRMGRIRRRSRTTLGGQWRPATMGTTGRR